MNDDVLIAKLKSAKKYFYYRYRNREDSEDFLGYVAEQILNGRDPTTTNKIFSIDYIRHLSPYSRNERRGEIMRESNSYIKEEIHKKERAIKVDVVKMIREAQLTDIGGAIGILFYKYGFTKVELGEVFNYSPTFIATIIKGINSRMKEVHGRD